MIRFLLVLCVLIARLYASEPSLFVLVGAPGQKEFEEELQTTAETWKKASESANRTFLEITFSQTNQLAVFTNALNSISTNGDQELWIVFIGHGTFDGREARFNLAGPDITATAMATLLQRFTRPIVLLNSASSSAPFLTKLSAKNRVVVTATKSGWEENYTRFGKYFSAALRDPTSDLDKDGQVSVLEGFLSASHQVNQFYKEEKRLATEHALIDDNGDGKGTPPSFFAGVRPAKKADDGTAVDGFRAHQLHFVQSPEEQQLSPELRKQRDELERSLETLRGRKAKMAEAEYLRELEKILLQIAKIYAAQNSSATNAPQPPVGDKPQNP